MCNVIAVLNIKINAHHNIMWLILNDLIPLSSNLSFLSPPRFLFETLLYLTLVVSFCFLTTAVYSYCLKQLQFSHNYI